MSSPSTSSEPIARRLTEIATEIALVSSLYELSPAPSTPSPVMSSLEDLKDPLKSSSADCTHHKTAAAYGRRAMGWLGDIIEMPVEDLPPRYAEIGIAVKKSETEIVKKGVKFLGAGPTVGVGEKCSGTIDARGDCLCGCGECGEWGWGGSYRRRTGIVRFSWCEKDLVHENLNLLHMKKADDPGQLSGVGNKVETSSPVKLHNAVVREMQAIAKDPVVPEEVQHYAGRCGHYLLSPRGRADFNAAYQEYAAVVASDQEAQHMINEMSHKKRKIQHNVGMKIRIIGADETDEEEDGDSGNGDVDEADGIDAECMPRTPLNKHNQVVNISRGTKTKFTLISASAGPSTPFGPEFSNSHGPYRVRCRRKRSTPDTLMSLLALGNSRYGISTNQRVPEILEHLIGNCKGKTVKQIPTKNLSRQLLGPESEAENFQASSKSSSTDEGKARERPSIADFRTKLPESKPTDPPPADPPAEPESSDPPPVDLPAESEPSDPPPADPPAESEPSVLPLGFGILMTCAKVLDNLWWRARVMYWESDEVVLRKLITLYIMRQKEMADLERTYRDLSEGNKNDLAIDIAHEYGLEYPPGLQAYLEEASRVTLEGYQDPEEGVDTLSEGAIAECAEEFPQEEWETNEDVVEDVVDDRAEEAAEEGLEEELDDVVGDRTEEAVEEAAEEAAEEGLEEDVLPAPEQNVSAAEASFLSRMWRQLEVRYKVWYWGLDAETYGRFDKLIHDYEERQRELSRGLEEDRNNLEEMYLVNEMIAIDKGKKSSVLKIGLFSLPAGNLRRARRLTDHWTVREAQRRRKTPPVTSQGRYPTTTRRRQKPPQKICLLIVGMLLKLTILEESRGTRVKRRVEVDRRRRVEDEEGIAKSRVESRGKSDVKLGGEEGERSRIYIRILDQESRGPSSHAYFEIHHTETEFEESGSHYSNVRLSIAQLCDVIQKGFKCHPYQDGYDSARRSPQHPISSPSTNSLKNATRRLGNPFQSMRSNSLVSRPKHPKAAAAYRRTGIDRRNGETRSIG
ncbi:hypothetical protein BC832DRAFT_538478 [Gaertneriomyces semiglobifer]|nr:hypothetical protein BC832DRAFT_538478 [Gaertneriomyces semiglobifer]